MLDHCGNFFRPSKHQYFDIHKVKVVHDVMPAKMKLKILAKKEEERPEEDCRDPNCNARSIQQTI